MYKSKNQRSSKLDRDSLERLAHVFRAFADATRLALLQELKEEEKSVSELLEALNATTQANVSRQLKILHLAGLLRRERRAAQVFYSIADPMVLELCNVACRKVNETAQAAQVPEFHI